MVKELRELGYLVLAPGEIISGGSNDAWDGQADIELTNSGILAIGAAEGNGGHYKSYSSPLTSWGIDSIEEHIIA